MGIFQDYSPEHEAELEELVASDRWQRTIDSGLVEEVKQGRIEPNPTRDYVTTVISQLLEFNEDKVKGLVAQGNIDEEYLFDVISTWPDNFDGKDPKLSFFGINLSTNCNFDPNRCIYCNQALIDSLGDMDIWKSILKEVTSNSGEEGPYVYFTGGEPLLLADKLYGDDGLIRYATEHGAGVNVNTNATMLTPEVALKLIKSGLGKLHISLDSPIRETQNIIYNADRYDKIIRGIYNLQIARDLVGVEYPVVHTNCVLTNLNYKQFPDLLEFILDKRKRVKSKANPLIQDLMTHVIPMGGEDNKNLRLSEDEFRGFYSGIWQDAKQKWTEYQDNIGISEESRITLFGFFSSPFERVEHKGGIDAYVEMSAQGIYSKLALSPKCYVAPTQASIAPDGTQYLCGSHAIHLKSPTGNVTKSGIFDSIRANIPVVSELPKEDYCSNYALATLYINQSVESKLKKRVTELVKENV
jgi:MoaA/NifB/PqqE/SkfB family radical SAM enzyme